MLSTKIRTTIITLVAAFSFAGASLVPTVAQAKIKKLPGESHKNYCAGLRAGYWADVEGMNEASTQESREAYAKEANEIVQAGREAGCWAARPQGSPTGGLRPVGGLQGAPEGATPPPIQVRTATFSPLPAQ
jgi:hypothetical protein